VSSQELDVYVGVLDGVIVGLEVVTIIGVNKGNDDVVHVGLGVGMLILRKLLASMSGLKSDRWSVLSQELGVDVSVVDGVDGVDVGLEVGSLVGFDTRNGRKCRCGCCRRC